MTTEPGAKSAAGSHTHGPRPESLSVSSESPGRAVIQSPDLAVEQGANDNGLIDSFAVRRPLIGPDGNVVGFEFRLTETIEGRLRSHPKALSAYAASLLSAARSTAEAGRSVLLTLPAEVVLRPDLVDCVPRGAWLVLHPWATDASELAALGELHVRGVRIGRVPPPFELAPGELTADFVRLSWDKDHPDALWGQITDWQRKRPGLPLVVTEVDHIDDMERVLRCRIALACGRLEKGLDRMIAAQRPVQPGTARLSQLLNEVMTGDTHKLAADISGDVVLSYKLLRFVNSPALGFSRAIDSIDQAVMVLGRKELYRWISILLLASANGLKASRALQEVSLWRARLLECLALGRDRPDEPPPALFTVGLLSLLDVMLQTPLAPALEPLRLSEAALAALLERKGPWAPYLELAAALESHQTWMAVSYADEFGGMAQVLAVSDAAWQWAAEATGHSHASPP